MSEIVATANTDYTSKQDLIEWINDSLKIKIQRIESLGTGAIYCQILDMINPGKVALNKVNWKAKFEYEYIANFKILQQSFQSLGISKAIEVNKLIKCKNLDNLEFIQWFRKYFEANNCPQNYDAVNRRCSEVDFQHLERQKGKESSLNKQKQSSQQQGKYLLPPRILQHSNSQRGGQSFSQNGSFLNELANEQEDSSNKTQNNHEKSPLVESLRAERDYYFSKLKDIDILLEMCQDQDPLLKEKIKEILYSTPDKIILVTDDGIVEQQNKENNSPNIIMVNGSQQQIQQKDKIELESLANSDFLINSELYLNDYSQQIQINPLKEISNNQIIKEDHQTNFLQTQNSNSQQLYINKVNSQAMDSIQENQHQIKPNFYQKNEIHNFDLAEDNLMNLEDDDDMLI